jgi:Glycosyl transferase family 2
METTTILPYPPALPWHDKDEELDRFLRTLLGPDRLPRLEPAPLTRAPLAHTLSPVLPAHNEENNLQAMTWAALETLPGIFRDCEIIVVDGGSIDATLRIADRLAAEDACVRVGHHPQNRGYGAAPRSGFAVARGRAAARAWSCAPWARPSASGGACARTTSRGR